MANGYIGLYRSVAIPIINTATFLLSVTEDVVKQGNGKYISIAKIEIENLDLIIGKITNIKVEKRLGDISACNYIIFKNNVLNNVTLTIASITYTFKTTFDTSNYQVKVGSTLEESCLNLYKAILREDPANNEDNRYKNVSIANPESDVKWVNNTVLNLIIKNPSSGNNYGNSYNASSSSSTKISIKDTYNSSAYFYGGCSAVDIDGNEWQVKGNYNVDFSSSGNNALLSVSNVPFSNEGVRNQFRLTFYNEKGQKALDQNNAEYIPNIVGIFDGETDILDELEEYAAVYNLRCVNAEAPEGGSSPSNPTLIPFNGIARLVWDDMSKFTVELKNHPVAADDGGSQKKIDITPRQLSNINEYVVFMFTPNTGATNFVPDPEYPNDLATNGTWRPVAKTQNNCYDISLPLNKVVSFWVGFSSKKTVLRTINPVLIFDNNTYSIESEYEEE